MTDTTPGRSAPDLRPAPRPPELHDPVDDENQGGWDWAQQSASQAACLFGDLGRFVAYFNHRYPWTQEQTIPPCWAQHGALIEELTTLMWSRWAAFQGPLANPETAQTWHTYHLPLFAARVTNWIGIEAAADCRSGHHQPSSSPAPINRLRQGAAGRDRPLKSPELSMSASDHNDKSRQMDIAPSWQQVPGDAPRFAPPAGRNPQLGRPQQREPLPGGCRLRGPRVARFPGRRHREPTLQLPGRAHVRPPRQAPPHPPRPPRSHHRPRPTRPVVAHLAMGRRGHPNRHPIRARGRRHRPHPRRAPNPRRPCPARASPRLDARHSRRAHRRRRPPPLLPASEPDRRQHHRTAPCFRINPRYRRARRRRLHHRPALSAHLRTPLPVGTRNPRRRRTARLGATRPAHPNSTNPADPGGRRRTPRPLCPSSSRARSSDGGRRPRGQRNHTLNRASYNLGTLVGAGILDQAIAASNLLQAAEAAGLGPQEITATIRSGLTSGIANPRQLPAPRLSTDSLAQRAAQPQVPAAVRVVLAP